MKAEATNSWVFLSVARSDGASLYHFFAAADHINCAIPTDQEIESAINYLRSGELVDVLSGNFHLTAKGRELFESVGGLQAFPRPQLESIKPLLLKAMQSVAVKAEWHVNPADTVAAVGQYSKLAKEVIANIAQQKKNKIK